MPQQRNSEHIGIQEQNLGSREDHTTDARAPHAEAGRGTDRATVLEGDGGSSTVRTIGGREEPHETDGVTVSG